FIAGQGISFQTFLFILFFSTVLALIYLNIALLLGSMAKNRWQALVGGITVWFLTFIIWPLLMISVPSQLPSSKLVQPALQILTILDPAEFIRVFSVMRMGAGSVFGADYNQSI